MKPMKLIKLFILALLCQVVLAQTNDIVKSFDFRVEESVEKGLDSTNIEKALNNQFEIPEYYEFKRQVIIGTKDRMNEKDDLGYIHERYAQFYKGIKIEHSDIRVRYLNGLFESANGQYVDVPNIDISAILSKENAIQKAKEYIGAKEYMWEDEAENNWFKRITNDKTASFYPNPEIVICKNSLDFKDTTFHIAYKLDVYAKKPLSRDYIFVDAKNGSILAVHPILVNATGAAATRYSGIRSISTQQNGGSYRLRGYDNTRSIETYNMNKGTNYSAATDFTDNDNNWTAIEFHNANKDDGALDAHWGAMMTYDYFKRVHGRNSFDNNGGILRNYVHTNLMAMNYSNNDNAFWNKNIGMTYGDGTSYDILTSLDIVAHEIGHGVCEYSAMLVYQGESGAINESVSDIWGACVENYAAPNKQIWLIGEDIGTALRSMSNPKSYGQPDTYGGTNWWDPSNLSWDHGGVHTNSGVMNHWFYILSVGKSGTNDLLNAYNVAGIGISKAQHIVYRALTNYMLMNATFASVRANTINAARNLYGANSPEVISTMNAWHAVGVGNKYITITGPSTLPCWGSKSYSVASLPAGYTWGSSTNITLSGASGNQVLATSNMTGSGYIFVKDNNGSEVGRIDVFAYKSTMMYPLSPVSGQSYPFGVTPACFTPTNYSWGVSISSCSTPYCSYSISPNGSSAYITFNGQGTYTVSVHMDTGLPNDFDYLSVTLNIYSRGGGSSSPFTVYPNPVNGVLYVDIDQQAIRANSPAGSKFAACEIRLYNMLGVQVLQTTSSNNKEQLNVSHLPDGMYFIHLYDGVNNTPEVKTVVIKH